MAVVVTYDPTDPDVPGRVTGYAASVHTPDYDADPNKLVNPDLSSVSGVPQRFWKHVSGSVVEMSSAEKDALYLGENKAAKSRAVDDRTDELIAQGFTHASKQFSLSLESQINWTNIGMNPSLLTYPYKVSTLLDDSVHEFANEAEVQSAYMTAVGTKEAHVSSGRTLKESIAAATTQAELDAVVDNR